MTSSPPTRAPTDTIESLRDEIKELKVALEAKEQVRVYCNGRATEYASEILQLKDLYEKKLADERARHGRELASVVVENARIQEKTRIDAEIMRGQQRRLEKYQNYNTNDVRTMRSLSAQNKALKQKNMELSQPEKASLSKKRGADSELSEDTPGNHKKPRPTCIIPCTQCKVHGWSCVGNEPCESCRLRNKHHSCKRVMCKYYTKNTCANMKCDMVHEVVG